MEMEAGPEEVLRAVSLNACAILDKLDAQELLLSSATCPVELSYSKVQLIYVQGDIVTSSQVCPAHIHFLLSQLSVTTFVSCVLSITVRKCKM